MVQVHSGLLLMLRCGDTHIPEYASCHHALPQQNYRYRGDYDGAIAQLGERLPCTQEVCGSIPHSSTIFTANTRKLQSEPEKVHCEVLLFKIWIKLKIETTHSSCVFESLKFSQVDDESKETSSGCEVKRLSVHGGCPAVRGDEGRANLRKAPAR